MEAILAEAQRLRLWRPLDVQFALMLATPAQPALMLACAQLSADAGAGRAAHCCGCVHPRGHRRLAPGVPALVATGAGVLSAPG